MTLLIFIYKLFAPLLLMRGEEINEDSNSFFSSNNMAPLAKRQTTAKKSERITGNVQEKIDSLGYQIVEELSIITPLEVHPSKFCEGIERFFYQRKVPSVMDAEFNKKEVKEKADFILALTSLFKKSLVNLHHKFVIVIPTGAIVYFFTEEVHDQPKLFIGSQHAEFAALLQREDIKYKQMKLTEFQRESLLLEDQQIKLFYGFVLNWIIGKKMNIDVHSNYPFDFSFKDTPLIVKHNQSRKENEHLMLKEESCIGEKVARLFIVKLQSVWFKDDISKIDERLKEFQLDYERRNRSIKIAHDYEFRISKFSLGLDQEAIDRLPKTSQLTT